jgi:hypothetical protein
MIQIVGYDNGIIKYECRQCVVSGTNDVSDYLSDDCVWVENIICGMCGGQQYVYILKCKTESKAKELSAELESLRFKRG